MTTHWCLNLMDSVLPVSDPGRRQNSLPRGFCAPSYCADDDAAMVASSSEKVSEVFCSGMQRPIFIEQCSGSGLESHGHRVCKDMKAGGSNWRLMIIECRPYLGNSPDARSS